MNLQQKIGQLIIAGFDGYEVNDHIKNLIVKHHVGNVILFEKNCKSPEQVFKLTQSLQQLAMKHNGTPLFIMIDQENGIVNRIFDGITVFPGNMAQTAGATLEETEDIAYFTGVGLKVLGVNFNLAPSLDVNNNPKNPVIGNRSFGDCPEVVSERGVAYIKGMKKAQMIATVKHFPGHGDTEIDSHLALPVVSHDVSRLENVELKPFKSAIDAGVQAIMSAHIQFPAWEKQGLPATLSHHILTTILRENLKFEGVVVTDCMEMKAIDDLYGTAIATPMAIRAGADLICISHTEEKQISALKEIQKALETETLTLMEIDRSFNRIMALKNAYDIDCFLKTTYDEALESLYLPEAEALADKVSKKSVQIVKNGNNLPITDKKTVVMAPDGRPLTGADGIRVTPNFAEFLTQRVGVAHNEPHVTSFKLPEILASEEIELAVRLASEHELVILCTQNALFSKEQQHLVQEVFKANPNVILIPLRNHHDINLFPDIPTCIVPYEYTPRSMSSLSNVLMNQ